MSVWKINTDIVSQVLVIPKKEIKNLEAATEEDALLLRKLQLTVAKVVRILGINEEGYRVITNIGNNGGQEVFHIHYHILGGEKLPTKLK